tara:strand:+ start:291 stop:629 length:339 start_codon:yes stop_codon:yes gene_type:complete
MMFSFFHNKGNDLIIDDLTEEIHEGTEIYLSWEFPKIVEKDFTCESCGRKTNIHVEYNISDLRRIVEDVNLRLNPSNRDDYAIKHKVQKAVVNELNTSYDLEHSVICENCKY